MTLKLVVLYDTAPVFLFLITFRLGHGNNKHRKNWRGDSDTANGIRLFGQ